MDKHFLHSDGVKTLWKKVLALTENTIDVLAQIIQTKADSVDANLEGTPTAPTAEAGTSTTQIATTEFVMTAITNSYEDVMNVLGETDSDLIIQ